MLGQHWQSSRLLRFARSCLVSSIVGHQDGTCDVARHHRKSTKSLFRHTKNQPRRQEEFHLVRGALWHVSTFNTHHHMSVPALGTANKAAQQVIHPGNLRENDLSHRRVPISVQAKLHLAVVGLVWRDWFCGKLQGS
jgi:hypothetical protein